MSCTYSINNSTSAEISVPASSTLSRHYFPQLQNLRGRSITGIESFGIDNMTNAPSGNAIITDTVAMCTFVTLVTADNEEFVYRMPYVSMCRTAGSASTFYQWNLKELDGKLIDFQKSYVEISDTSTIAGTVASFFFTLYYE